MILHAFDRRKFADVLYVLALVALSFTIGFLAVSQLPSTDTNEGRATVISGPATIIEVNQ